MDPVATNPTPAPAPTPPPSGGNVSSTPPPSGTPHEPSAVPVDTIPNPLATPGTDPVQTPEPTGNPTDPFDAFLKQKNQQPSGDPQPEPQPGDPQPAPVDWKDQIPQVYRNNSYLSRFESMEEFMKGVENLRSLASKKGLERPAEDAPPEAWNDYWKTIGRPDTPDAYDIQDLKDSAEQVVFEFDRETLGELQKEFHKKGYTNDQAQFAMDQYAQLKLSESQAAEQAKMERTTQTRTSLEREYKEATDAVITRGLHALENVGLYDLAVEMGMETDERFVRAGIKLSEEFGEATVGPKASIRDSNSRLTEIENSKAFQDARDPNHKRVVAERLEILNKMVN